MWLQIKNAIGAEQQKLKHYRVWQLRVTRRYFIPLFEFLSLIFPLNFQLINFPLLHERILLYFSCPCPYNVSNGPRPSSVYPKLLQYVAHAIISRTNILKPSLSCSYGEKAILGKDNRKYVFKQVCEMLSLAIRS